MTSCGTALRLRALGRNGIYLLETNISAATSMVNMHTRNNAI